MKNQGNPILGVSTGTTVSGSVVREEMGTSPTAGALTRQTDITGVRRDGNDYTKGERLYEKRKRKDTSRVVGSDLASN